MKRKSKQHLFTIFGLEVNLSAVLTTVVGSLSWLLITTGLKWVHDIKVTLSAVPALVEDVREVKKEQGRIKKQYSPEIRPTPSSFPASP